MASVHNRSKRAIVEFVVNHPALCVPTPAARHIGEASAHLPSAVFCEGGAAIILHLEELELLLACGFCLRAAQAQNIFPLVVDAAD